MFSSLCWESSEKSFVCSTDMLPNWWAVSDHSFCLLWDCTLHFVMSFLITSVTKIFVGHFEEKEEGVDLHHTMWQSIIGKIAVKFHSGVFWFSLLFLLFCSSQSFLKHLSLFLGNLAQSLCTFSQQSKSHTVKVAPSLENSSGANHCSSQGASSTRSQCPFSVQWTGRETQLLRRGGLPSMVTH